MTDTPQLLRWRSHKVVEAAKIIEVFVSRANKPVVRVESPDGDETKFVAFDVPEDFSARGTAEPGDYFIRYKDGYMSWSPAKEFEDGYTLVDC